MSTVRDLVKAMQHEIGTSEFRPEQARSILLRLSALWGNVLTEIREADTAYAHVLLAHLNSGIAANQAKIRSEVTPEYQRMREARDTEKLMNKMNSNLRSYLRSLEAEMRL